MANSYDIWKEHPEYREKFNEIQSFCQSNSFSEDDAWEMMASFEDREFGKTQSQLLKRKQEIVDLLKAIDFTYDYLEKLKNEQE